MTRTELVGLVVLAVSCAGAGWWVGRQAPPIRAPATVLPVAPANLRSTAPTAKPVQVHADGTVSINVHAAPLPWLFEQIEHQGGRVPGQLAERLPSAVAVAAGAGDESRGSEACREPVSPAQVIQTLRQGTDAERLAALADALANDVELPAAVLKQLIETDPSEPVRLAAFDVYVDRAGGDVDAVRPVLEAARHNPSAAVQADARRRSDELERAQQMRPPDDPQVRR